MFMYSKDLSEPKYKYSIKKHENVGTEHLGNSKVFIEFWNTMDDVYENIHDYNLNRKKN